MPKDTPIEMRSSYKSKAWQGMIKAWKITSDLWAGALSLRDKGSSYLLKFPKEDDAAYQERKEWRSVFYDGFKRTITGFAGLTFDENPSPQKAPQPILDLFSDIDLCGNDFYTFLLTSFEKYLRDGNGFFLATAPHLTEYQQTALEQKGSLSIADRLNDRPYGIFFTASQCINHFYDEIDGRNELSQITIEEKCLERVSPFSFGEKEVIKHRIYRRGSLEIRTFQSTEDLDNDNFTSDFFELGYDDIMIVPIADIGTEPPFLSIALSNIEHYNTKSDFANWNHRRNVPHPVFVFDTKEDADKFNETLKTVSPNMMIGIWGQYAKAYYLEVSGAGAEITQKYIKELHEDMSRLGLEKLQPTAPSSSRKTATEINSDNIQSHSELITLVRKFENAVERFIYNLGVVYNDIKPNTVKLEEVEPNKIKLNINYKKLAFPLQSLDIIRSLTTDGVLSIETLVEMLPTMLEALPENWSKELEMKRLKEQKAELVAMEEKKTKLLDDGKVEKPKVDDELGSEK